MDLLVTGLKVLVLVEAVLIWLWGRMECRGL